MTMHTARDRAEELLETLQRRAKDFVAADEGLLKSVRDASHLLERPAVHDAMATLADYREELERRLEAVVHRVLASLQLATHADLDGVNARLATLTQRIEQLQAKIEADRR